MVHSNKKFLTLSEAAELLGKSVQTVRRMIKKGDIQAKRIKTPQGFHYVVSRELIEPKISPTLPSQNQEEEHHVESEEKVEKPREEILHNSTSQTPIQTENTVHTDKPLVNSTSQDDKLYSQKDINALIEGDFYAIDKTMPKVEPVAQKAPEHTAINIPVQQASPDDLLKMQRLMNGHNTMSDQSTELVEGIQVQNKELIELLKRAHDERVFLYGLIGRLQKELDIQKRKPHGLLERLMDWLTGRG